MKRQYSSSVAALPRVGMMGGMPSLVVPFALRGVAGQVVIDLMRNEDPVGWGCHLLTDELPRDAAESFPVCLARIEHPARGYAAAVGWVQLVQSTDSEGDPSTYEIDPTTIYREVATPFAWFGVKPDLFDAPFRGSKYQMIWRARSYLCVSPDAVMTRAAEPLCAFAWGFDVDANGSIKLMGPSPLDLTTWKEHVELLRSLYPCWAFLDGTRR